MTPSLFAVIAVVGDWTIGIGLVAASFAVTATVGGGAMGVVDVPVVVTEAIGMGDVAMECVATCGIGVVDVPVVLVVLVVLVAVTAMSGTGEVDVEWVAVVAVAVVVVPVLPHVHVAVIVRAVHRLVVVAPARGQREAPGRNIVPD